MSYLATRDRVESYFDGSATKVWERLTSDAPVSGVRATVRAGRDRMRALMLAQLPTDLTGTRVLDAGCGTGAASVELARRGADVVAVDISPALVEIARKRMPDDLAAKIDWRSGDMLAPELGKFDHVIAMDSMIYYTAEDITDILGRAAPRVSGKFVFTLAPRTVLLSLMFNVGKLFPKKDRSPVMIPHTTDGVRREMEEAGVPGVLSEVEQVTSGFYISKCHVFEAVA